MLFMPSDDPLGGPSNAVCDVLSEDLVAGYLASNTDPKELVKEVESLLVAVDLAISQDHLSSDKQWTELQTSWAFLGPGLSKRVEVLKFVANSRTLIGTREEFYSRVAFIQMLLTIRRQTLELNDIEFLGKLLQRLFVDCRHKLATFFLHKLFDGKAENNLFICFIF